MIEEEEIESGLSFIAGDFFKAEAYALFFEFIKSPLILIFLWIEHDFYLLAAILILGGFLMREELPRLLKRKSR